MGTSRGHQAGSSETFEQAKLELSERYGLRLDEASEVLTALARSQRRNVEEFADSVVSSGGRLDGDVRGESGGAVAGFTNGRGTTVQPELLVEAPSAAAAFVLAGSLADYDAHASVERGVWRRTWGRAPIVSRYLRPARRGIGQRVKLPENPRRLSLRGVARG